MTQTCLSLNQKGKTMRNIIVVNNPKEWNIEIDAVEIVDAKSYLGDSAYAQDKKIHIFNLCRYEYQRKGYYVSLLAEARGQKVIPDVSTIQDLKSQAIIRVISDDIDQLIQKELKKLKSDEFVLSIYFGKNVAKQYNYLAKRLYGLFQAPLMRVNFVRKKKWIVQNVTPISLCDIPPHHLPYISEFAKGYFSKKHVSYVRKNNSQYDLAILINPTEKSPPSDKKALELFVSAAEDKGFSVELISRDDFARIAEFDALFIRETTSVNHHTYRFARRAEAEGLIVLDDPYSILKCTNKVYLSELLSKAKIPTPKTLIIHKTNRHLVEEELGFPCILKLPDGAFSTGVVKVEDKKQLDEALENFLSRSDLVIAQKYTPTDFDWRIAVIDKIPIFSCKYFMAKDHWQIYNWSAQKKDRMGLEFALPLEETPQKVIDVALKAANLIGDGFYGVDLKQVGDEVVVIEINDNPSVEHGIEDGILKEKLYSTIVDSFVARIQKRKNGEKI